MSVPLKRWHSVVSEVELSLSMRHPNILKAIGYFQADDPAEQHAAAAAAGAAARGSSYSPWARLQLLGVGLRQRSRKGLWSSGSSVAKDSKDAVMSSDESKDSARASGRNEGIEAKGRGIAGPSGSEQKVGAHSSGSDGHEGPSSDPGSTKRSGDALGRTSGQGWGNSRADAYVDVWLVTEYCRLGTLSQAILDGLLDAKASFLPDMVRRVGSGL